MPRLGSLRPLRKAALVFALLPVFSSQAPAQLVGADGAKPPKKIPPELQVPPPKPQPWLLRMMIHDLRRGMFIGLPVVDTNPNKGTTYGVMPIWVLHGEAGTRIKHIFAPSLTYNPTFQWEPTGRYYFYPTEHASYFLRGSWSGNKNKDLIGKMEDLDFLGRGIAVAGSLALDTDGSKRFFGVGPATSRRDETNFTRQTVGYTWNVGLPIFTGSRWKFNVGHHLAGEKIDDGVIGSLVNIRTRFPGVAPRHFHQDSELQLFVDYDTRDSANTSSEGSYLKFLLENAQRSFGSEFTFQRYAIDLRHFRKPERKNLPTTAVQFKFEQLTGDAPFYLLPSLGGRKSHRAYGDGRFLDRGMSAATLEERFTVHSVAVAGVTTELELAPFAGAGAVFDSPGELAARYVRPVFGISARAIARPQVVGSVDIGIGQEGPSVFMDINYPF